MKSREGLGFLILGVVAFVGVAVGAPFLFATLDPIQVQQSAFLTTVIDVLPKDWVEVLYPTPLLVYEPQPIISEYEKVPLPTALPGYTGYTVVEYLEPPSQVDNDEIREAIIHLSPPNNILDAFGDDKADYMNAAMTILTARADDERVGIANCSNTLLLGNGIPLSLLRSNNTDDKGQATIQINPLDFNGLHIPYINQSEEYVFITTMWFIVFGGGNVCHLENDDLLIYGDALPLYISALADRAVLERELHMRD